MRFRLFSILTVCGVLTFHASAQSNSKRASGSSPSTITASFYGNRMNGHRTASGERLNNNALTAAHKTYPLGTRLRLRNVRNHRSVVVRVNDRGPFVSGRDISVTRRAAQRLGFTKTGTAQVEVEELGRARSGTRRHRARRR